jgi:hypothetical protein
VLTLALVLATRVVVVPGVADDALHAAAHSVGVDVVDDDAARAALALVDDPSCRAGDARCLARLALVAEADAVVVVTTVDGDRIDAVVVTTAAERRRVQTPRATLVDDVARALAPPAGARLHLRGEAAFALDDHPVDPAGDHDVDVTPGEHRIVATRAGHATAAVVIDVAAGEALWIAPTLSPLTAPAPSPTTPLWWTATAAAVGTAGVGALVAAGGFGNAAFTAVQDAEAATFQSERIEARDAANANIAGAAVASSLGAVAVATAMTMVVVGGPP